MTLMGEINWLSMALITETAILTLGFGIILARGGKLSRDKSGWSIEAPSPTQKVLRERDGSRVFVDFDAAERITEYLSELNAERLAALPSATARAMEYTAQQIDSFLYDVDEAFAKLADPNDPAFLILLRTVGNATANCRHSLIKTLLEPSFVNNGFHSYRTKIGGVVSDSRDWIDYLAERQETVGRFVRHYLRNKLPGHPAIFSLLENVEKGKLREALEKTVKILYERYWAIWDQHNERIKQIANEKIDYVAKIRGGQLD
jgi:hypothetical protein